MLERTRPKLSLHRTDHLCHVMSLYQFLTWEVGNQTQGLVWKVPLAKYNDPHSTGKKIKILGYKKSFVPWKVLYKFVINVTIYLKAPKRPLALPLCSSTLWIRDLQTDDNTKGHWMSQLGTKMSQPWSGKNNFLGKTRLSFWWKDDQRIELSIVESVNLLPISSQ